jgi:sarcosine oxidase/L-pipecolate oxidase
MKIAAIHFVTNYAPSHAEMSLPRYRSDNPTDGIPEKVETHLRNWMKEFVPELADREWVETRICWYVTFVFCSRVYKIEFRTLL